MFLYMIQSGKVVASNPARLRLRIRQGCGRLSGKAAAVNQIYPFMSRVSIAVASTNNARDGKYYSRRGEKFQKLCLASALTYTCRKFVTEYFHPELKLQVNR